MPAEQLGGLTPLARLRRTPAGPGSPALALGAGCLWGHPLTAPVPALGGPAEGCPGGGWVSPRVRRRPSSPFLPPQVLEGAALSARRESGGGRGGGPAPPAPPSAPSGAGWVSDRPFGRGGRAAAVPPAQPDPDTGRRRLPAHWKLARNRRGGSAGGGAWPGPSRPSRQVWGASPRRDRQRQNVCLWVPGMEGVGGLEGSQPQGLPISSCVGNVPL